jgi:hypothetical protein
VNDGPLSALNGAQMSVRLARMIAVLWVVVFAATLAVGGACAAIGEWRLRVSSSEATATNTVAYVEHGRTCFAPPHVAKWYNRSTSTFPPLLAGVGVLTVMVFVSAWQSGAIGRRLRGR